MPMFMDSCRTVDNPSGWVAGTGPGGTLPAGLWTYAQYTGQDKSNLDALMVRAQQNVAGGYWPACPKTPAAIAAARASSPFLNPATALPPTSPYYVNPAAVFTPAQATAVLQPAATTTATTSDWIAGIPNQYVMIGGAAAAAALLLMAGKR